MSPVQAALKSLRPFMERTRKVATSKPTADQTFDICVRAAFAKAYDFAVFVHSRKKPQDAFFYAPSLRSICEDVIVLGYLATRPEAERNEIVGAGMVHEVDTSIGRQATFFRRARRHQLVLAPGDKTTAAARAAEYHKRVRKAWEATDLPMHNPKAERPTTRAIAVAQGVDILTALYDFLFSFTSGAVHHSPATLIRLAWGDGKKGFICRASNFDVYYYNLARVYSVFLLCAMFERLAGLFPLGATHERALKSLRKSLRSEVRWPEIVTFEEMNVGGPRRQIITMLGAFLDAQTDRPVLDLQPPPPSASEEEVSHLQAAAPKKAEAADPHA
jgi:hypothetical protein